ncbi:ATP synthase F0F1 subunit epsilon [Ureibacillus massiliensis 4400831 = CIP 108448 = CCUG 49529]|uniref:ATP synthase epsilon chain n=1 Tax=Ureibacillus massiliensis 4400831 = CIP 108448 = CCUG 49529 TaxID=1211035 RepID=A0A0A3JZS8_9BACL|nr:F0F1 ATP synthase subunit epsilon [Ureibacillus massiliensis]KGR92492.1 ATP synthase F0F1 subunit epsilon [Ureibacillus massiliensis 4400831 = CIP 108448 = CCUG 49529]BDH60628.1 ATP synthase epsilon chain [Lysinibacillus sp. PLM2]
MKTVQVNIVTPDGPVYDSEVAMVIAKTISGEIGVLPGHIPLVSPLSIGGVELKDANGKSEFVAVSGGFIEVRPEKVSILAPSAEVASSIDLARAQEAKARAEERLKMKNDEIDFQRAELALRRAMNRINVHEGNV